MNKFSDNQRAAAAAAKLPPANACRNEKFRERETLTSSEVIVAFAAAAATLSLTPDLLSYLVQYVYYSAAPKALPRNFLRAPARELFINYVRYARNFRLAGRAYSLLLIGILTREKVHVMRRTKKKKYNIGYEAFKNFICSAYYEFFFSISYSETLKLFAEFLITKLCVPHVSL